jgi:glycosyltransferase involved in cell wall biosynthesis
MQSNHTNPLVSVVLPVFNAASYLHDAIESILQQSYSNFELIIINDGSSDSSLDIIKSFDDKRIRYVENKENIGLIKTLNRAFELANGSYIARMDADDRSFNQRFEKQIEYLEENTQIGVLGTGFISFGNVNEQVIYKSTHQEIRWMQLYECHILHPSVMIRTSVYRDHEFSFNPQFAHCEDYELWARMSQKVQFANLQEPLVYYRDSDSNISNTYTETQYHNSIIVRQYLFSCIGVKEVSKKEIQLFENTSYYNYPNDISSLTLLGDFLEKMDFANKSSKYFSNDFFPKKINDMWYHACVNSCHFGLKVAKLYNQKLRRKKRITDVFKIAVKCLQKKQFIF